MTGNNLYLKTNDEMAEELMYESERKVEVGEYLIEGIEADKIEKSYVGYVTREQEHYWVLIMITDSGDVYYYSDYLSDNHIAQKINVSKKFIDVREANYVYLSAGNEWTTGNDIVLITAEGGLFSFENMIRRLR